MRPRRRCRDLTATINGHEASLSSLLTMPLARTMLAQVDAARVCRATRRLDEGEVRCLCALDASLPQGGTLVMTWGGASLTVCGGEVAQLHALLTGWLTARDVLCQVHDRGSLADALAER